MRLWSLHPCYLDAKGLVALWREALLARAVLEGKTRGYRRHPQLDRFVKSGKAVDAVNCYLQAVYDEASSRGYHFNRAKLVPVVGCVRLPVCDGQLRFEWRHLATKLAVRDPDRYKRRYKRQASVAMPLPHPLFYVVEGPVEQWEKTER